MFALLVLESAVAQGTTVPRRAGACRTAMFARLVLAYSATAFAQSYR